MTKQSLSPQADFINDEKIKKHLGEIPNTKIREQTKERLKQIEAGERSLYF
jgi:hypothetical protein